MYHYDCSTFAVDATHASGLELEMDLDTATANEMRTGEGNF